MEYFKKMPRGYKQVTQNCQEDICTAKIKQQVGRYMYVDVKLAIEYLTTIAKKIYVGDTMCVE